MKKQTIKQTFLLKMTIGMLFAIHAGGVIASIAEYPYLNLGRLSHFTPGFIYTFFPLACIVAMQWLLLSDHLPKWWIALGFSGCVIAATVVGIFYLFVTNDIYNSYELELQTFKGAIAGIFLALPQLIILRDKKVYLWTLANGIGLAIYFFGAYSIIGVPVQNGSYFTLERVLSLVIPIIPFGLMTGLYLYTYIYQPNHLQPIEEGKP